jgi:threonine dehydrogenase-like Zn-dependent dehydrogenase
MSDSLEHFKQAEAPLPKRYRLWPLYGAGLENMGRDGQTIEVDMQPYGPDEILVRHDAVGLCFSDIKVIAQGQNHPRIYDDMQKKPVVLGHEVSMTVVGVGENLKNEYKPGDRLIIQADIYVNGVSLAYGYTFQGGLSQYAVIDKQVINSDFGNMLIRVEPTTGYAESALTEPWACVIAAYKLDYRQSIKAGGTLWIIGTGDERPYTITTGFDQQSHPDCLALTNVPETFAAWLRGRAAELGVQVLDVPDVNQPPFEYADDIALLGADPGLVEAASPRLAQYGVFAILAERPMPRKVSVDVGRVHYHRWLYAGTTKTDVSAAYTQSPVRATLKPGGKAWFVGAGGPIGRMHVQRAISFANPPSAVVNTDVSDDRLDDLCASFGAEAETNGIDWVCLNPMQKEAYSEAMTPFFETGFDDIIVLAPVPPVIADAATHAAPGATINVFAGVARGTMVDLDLSDVYLKEVRMIGHSGSEIGDMFMTLDKAASNELSRNRSVAAVGSLSAARDGLKAVKDTTFPGKVVIYPNIKEFPLTPITELEDKLPSVFARLKDGREWTNEAEAEFLRLMLP